LIGFKTIDAAIACTVAKLNFSAFSER